MTHYALIGVGKTGGAVRRLLQGHQISWFDRQHPVCTEQLQRCDVAIVFVPGREWPAILPLLIASSIPVVVGCTPWHQPESLDSTLRQRGVAWIYGANFSPGMLLVKGILNVLADANQLWPDAIFALDETHHIHKKDKPSGTALMWQQWLGHPAEMMSHRVGDVIGDHRIKVQGTDESLTFTHRVQSREVFARGAILAANHLLRLPQLQGMIRFEDLLATAMSGSFGSQSPSSHAGLGAHTFTTQDGGMT